MARSRPTAAAPDLVTAIGECRRIAIRAGSQPHRFIPLWVVVVERRFFVRSWSLKPGSWYHALVREPHGVLKVGEREVPFRAARPRSERIKTAVDRAYRQKYDKPSEIGFVRDMCGAKSKATTTELVPVLSALLVRGPGRKPVTAPGVDLARASPSSREAGAQRRR